MISSGYRQIQLNEAYPGNWPLSILSTLVLSLYRPLAKFVAQTCVAKSPWWGFILVACEGLKRDFVPTSKLELVDPRSLNRITIPRTFQTSPGTTKLRLFAGSFLICVSHDWMRLLCAASVQCFVNISWIVTYEERWILTSIENPCHIAVIQWRLLWHWKLRTGKLLFGGYSSKSLQWVLYTQWPFTKATLIQLGT